MSDGLRGRTVLLVGTESRVAALERRLGESGATVVPFPTVRTAPPANPDPLDRALRRWRSYDWVVFTSSNGVDHVVSHQHGGTDDFDNLAFCCMRCNQYKAPMLPAWILIPQR